MKGVVFTEFIDHAEAAFGEDVVDDVIEAADLPSGGAYTSVGTYDFQEMVALVTGLSKATSVPASDLIHGFGVHLGGSFQDKFQMFFEQQDDLFDFLDSVEKHIHIEVQKLYPDAELPSLKMVDRAGDTATLRYRSMRCLEQLACGLIEASAGYFKVPIEITLSRGEDSGGQYSDIIIKKAAA